MDFLWSICGLDAAAGGPLMAGMLFAGLLGGFGHCSLMCGPFALAQIAERFAAGASSRLWTATLMPYQAGRLTTYAALGAVAGGLGAATSRIADLGWLPAAALMVAAMVFAAQAVGRIRGGSSGFAARFGKPRGFALGLALGFLPCGLIYGALIAAAGSGGAWQGALGMALFGLGTVPSLVAVGWLGLAAGKRWRTFAQMSAPYFGFANAVILAVLALRAL